jgi:hypothetical protein
MLKWLIRGFLALVVESTVMGVATHAAEPIANVRQNRAAWMAQATFGVMTHYLVEPKGNSAVERRVDLNRIVDHFDLDRFIEQFQATGADWLIFTIGQNKSCLCSPNPFLEGKDPIQASRRDLVMEIGQRLHTIGKRLIVYLPSCENAEVAMKEALDFDAAGYDDRYFEMIRQYSVKFGMLHDGWWFDSCGPHPDEYWLRYLAAARAGNPDAAVAFSGAEFCGGPITPICMLADYHAGEIHMLEDSKIRIDFLGPPGVDIVVTAQGKLRKRGRAAHYYLPKAPLINGMQWHGLLPIDLTFNPAIPNQFCHYTDKELLVFVRSVKSVGGAITINVPIETETGHIPDDSHSQLVRLSKALKGE